MICRDTPTAWVVRDKDGICATFAMARYLADAKARRMDVLLSQDAPHSVHPLYEPVEPAGEESANG